MINIHSSVQVLDYLLQDNQLNAFTREENLALICAEHFELVKVIKTSIVESIEKLEQLFLLLWLKGKDL